MCAYGGAQAQTFMGCTLQNGPLKSHCNAGTDLCTKSFSIDVEGKNLKQTAGLFQFAPVEVIYWTETSVQFEQNITLDPAVDGSAQSVKGVTRLNRITVEMQVVVNYFNARVPVKTQDETWSCSLNKRLF